MPIDVRTHPDALPEERETSISLTERPKLATVYSEQPPIVRKLLRNEVADIWRVGVFEDGGEDVVYACWAYLPLGAVSIATPTGMRKSERLSKVHSDSGITAAGEMFRGGLDAVVESGDGPYNYVEVPDDVRAERLVEDREPASRPVWQTSEAERK